MDEAAPFIELLRKRRVESLLYIAHGVTPPPQCVYNRYWERQQEQHLELLGELELRGIPVITFKGAELVSRFYGGAALGFLADVDVLVERKAIPEVKAVCHNLGWRQGNLEEGGGARIDELDHVEIGQAELAHYELVPFRRGEDMHITSGEEAFAGEWSRPPLWPGQAGLARAFFKLDVHWKAVSDIDAGPLFKRSVPSSLGVGLTLSPADHLWLTLAKLYFEVSLLGKRYLRDFAYVAPILATEDIDWDVVLIAHRENNLGPGLFYYLSFLNALEQCVPNAVLELLHPGSCLPSNRDWGWQLSQLFGGVDAFPSLAGLSGDE